MPTKPTHGTLQHSATSQHRVSRAIETRVKHDEIIAESKSSVEIESV